MTHQQSFIRGVVEALKERRPAVCQLAFSVNRDPHLLVAWPEHGVSVRFWYARPEVSLVVPGTRSCWRYGEENWVRIADELLAEVFVVLE